MPYAEDSLFVVTGGPGAGKTTLLEACAQSGFAMAEEVGRAIIRDQTRISGRALPWDDPALYSEMMLSWEIRSHRIRAARNEICFFDRGIPDVIGYLRLIGMVVPEHMQIAAEQMRYNIKVFIMPPWPEIFEQDSERKQTIDEAERTYQALSETYPDFGYELVEIPRLSVEARLNFILEAVLGG